MTLPAYLELRFCPNVELVSLARRFVSDVYGKLLGDPDATSRIALATHELLENAVKYSADGSTTIRIEIDRLEGRPSIRVRTTNRAAPEHVASVREIVDGIAGAEDPSSYYVALMRRTAKRAEGSGLGLARVCVEAEMSMRYERAGDELTLIAEAPLAAEVSP